MRIVGEIKCKPKIGLTLEYQGDLGISYPSLKLSCELVISQEIDL